VSAKTRSPPQGNPPPPPPGQFSALGFALSLEIDPRQPAWFFVPLFRCFSTVLWSRLHLFVAAPTGGFFALIFFKCLLFFFRGPARVCFPTLPHSSPTRFLGWPFLSPPNVLRPNCLHHTTPPTFVFQTVFSYLCNKHTQSPVCSQI